VDRKADEDDVGRSSKSKRARFRGDIMRSGDPSSGEVFGDISSMSPSDGGCGSSVRNLDVAGDLKRERGIGCDIQIPAQHYALCANLKVRWR